MSDQIKVLVVDDSSLVRKIIIDILESDPQIKVIGTAETGEAAVTMASKLDPDVITMDIEMPVLDGLTALKRIIATNPKPVIMMSVFTQHGAEETFKALEYGAVDFIPKPSSMLSPSVNEIGEQLRTKVKSVYQTRITSGDAGVREKAAEAITAAAGKTGKKPARTFDRNSFSSRIVGIGTSTGGPAALMQVFSRPAREFSVVDPGGAAHAGGVYQGLRRATGLRCRTSTSRRPRTWTPSCRAAPSWRRAIRISAWKKRTTGGMSGYSRVKRSRATGRRLTSCSIPWRRSAGKDTVAVIMTGMGRDGADGIAQDQGARRPHDSPE